MNKLINRLYVSLLNAQLRKFCVVAVVGARQVGKTTMVKELLKNKRPYYTLDDPAVAQLAETNPISFLSQAKEITIDEIQKCPGLLTGIKRIIDEKKVAGQFIITGSANITQLPRVSETLAGRVSFVDVMPLTIFETHSLSKNRPKVIEVISCQTAKKSWQLLNEIGESKFILEKTIFRGGYPLAWLNSNDNLRQEWFKAYVRTYLERDVRDLSRIQKLYEYQKFLTLTAFRCAQVLNRSDLARDTGIPNTTAQHFFDLLLATFQIFLLEPYFRNIGKRLTKSPKLMWNDTGVALYLQGLSRWEDAERLGRSSFLVENKIAIEIKTLLSVYLPAAKLFYWRTSAGAEIDFLVENKGQLIPIEVKWKEKINRKDLVSMEIFLKDFKKISAWGIVLYAGKQILKLKENIFLVPFERFLG
jgi:predicted AAA+ superfamily ATPase